MLSVLRDDFGFTNGHAHMPHRNVLKSDEMTSMNERRETPGNTRTVDTAHTTPRFSILDLVSSSRAFIYYKECLGCAALRFHT